MNMMLCRNKSKVLAKRLDTCTDIFISQIRLLSARNCVHSASDLELLARGTKIGEQPQYIQQLDN